MIFNTNKNTQCNKKNESLSYYTYTSERKYSDSSNLLHDNFCKNIKNTSTLVAPISLDNSHKDQKKYKSTNKNCNSFRSKKQSPRIGMARNRLRKNS